MLSVCLQFCLPCPALGLVEERDKSYYRCVAHTPHASCQALDYKQPEGLCTGLQVSGKWCWWANETLTADTLMASKDYLLPLSGQTEAACKDDFIADMEVNCRLMGGEVKKDLCKPGSTDKYCTTYDGLAFAVATLTTCREDKDCLEATFEKLWCCNAIPRLGEDLCDSVDNAKRDNWIYGIAGRNCKTSNCVGVADSMASVSKRRPALALAFSAAFLAFVSMHVAQEVLP